MCRVCTANVVLWIDNSSIHSVWGINLKELGSDVEMFEILHRDRNFKQIFTQKESL